MFIEVGHILACARRLNYCCSYSRLVKVLVAFTKSKKYYKLYVQVQE